METIAGTAVVAGGSIAGLAAALALAPRMSRVVVLERHRLPDSGEVATIVPQGAFPHVLLAGGAAALERLAPGFTAALTRAGAVGGPGPRPCHWWAAGAVRRVIPDVGVDAPMCSRELVESTLRDLLRARSGVQLFPETTVRGLRLAGGRVVGVEATGSAGDSSIEADLFVDATGRAARSVAWLGEHGVPEPVAEQVHVGVTYTSVEVERDAADLGGGLFAVVQNSRGCPRIGVALPTESGTWRVVLGGYFGEAAPLDREGLLTFAASLPDQALHPLVARSWAGPPRRHAFPASQRRGWASVPLPAGFCALGDAVASFNPVYGQGMSSAARQAEALGQCLDRHGNSRALPRTVARRTAKVAGDPWRIATGADFVYDRTVGAKPRGTDAVNGYLERVMRVAAQDPAVNLALSRVQLLLAPPQSLTAPSVLARVLGSGARRASRGRYAAPAGQRPFHTGGRFSTNALNPSSPSSEP